MKKRVSNLTKNLGLLGTDKEISVRVRSDLHNVIKNAQSIVNDFQDLNDIENIDINTKEGV